MSSSGRAPRRRKDSPIKDSPISAPVFPLFEQLPRELRNRIWALSTPTSRVIEIVSPEPPTEDTIPDVPALFGVCAYQIPSILHACRESREEGLRMYPPVDIGVSLSPGSNTPPNTPGATCRPVHLDLTKDIIYLGYEFRKCYLRKYLETLARRVSGLQYLALNGVCFRGDYYDQLSRQTPREDLMWGLYALHHQPLKEIYIVPGEDGRRRKRSLLKRKLMEPPRADQCLFKHDPDDSDDERPYGYPVFDIVTIPGNLGLWFKRLWGAKGLVPPVAMFKRAETDDALCFRLRLGDVQEYMGDMAGWKTWNPMEG